jgi:hypothetical protein
MLLHFSYNLEEEEGEGRAAIPVLLFRSYILTHCLYFIYLITVCNDDVSIARRTKFNEI